MKPGPNGGLDVPKDAYDLMFELESRSFMLSREGDKLKIQGKDGTRPALSDEERVRIVRWKSHILAMLAYIPPEV